jgi:hypothetical protein
MQSQESELSCICALVVSNVHLYLRFIIDWLIDRLIDWFNAQRPATRISSIFRTRNSSIIYKDYIYEVCEGRDGSTVSPTFNCYWKSKENWVGTTNVSTVSSTFDCYWKSQESWVGTTIVSTVSPTFHCYWRSKESWVGTTNVSTVSPTFDCYWRSMESLVETTNVSTVSPTFDCYWKSKENWVGTTKLFCRAYNVPTLFWNLQQR